MPNQYHELRASAAFAADHSGSHARYCSRYWSGARFTESPDL